jgi:hypothetical protein
MQVVPLRCGAVTAATNAGVHARVALLRGHVFRALMSTLPGAGSDVVGLYKLRYAGS